MPIRKTTTKELMKYQGTAVGLIGVPRKSMLRNEILQKAPTGSAFLRGRPTQDKNFSYGIKTNTETNVVAKSLRWRSFQGQIDDPSFYPRDFIRTNNEAIKTGLHTAPQFFNFAKNNDFRIKPRKVCRRGKIVIPDMVFGMPHRPGSPMGEVLAQKEGNDWHEWAIERNKKRIDKIKMERSKLRRPFDCLTSSFNMIPGIHPPKKEDWQMARFQNIGGDVSSFRGENARLRAIQRALKMF